jgi:rubrerythrin
MSYFFNAEEVFDIAIEIEENGKNFYEKAQGKTDVPAIKELFDYLAAEEVSHKARFEALKSELPESARDDDIWDPENEMNQYLKMMADTHVFRSGKDVEEKLNQIGGGAEALKMAMDFEKDSIVFFLTMQDVTSDVRGKEKIGLLVKEEQEHLKKLSLKLQELFA